MSQIWPDLRDQYLDRVVETATSANITTTPVCARILIASSSSSQFLIATRRSQCRYLKVTLAKIMVQTLLSLDSIAGIMMASET